jgi:hypothetical protein
MPSHGALPRFWTIIDPPFLDEITATTEDEAHFRFLLGLALERAIERNTDIMLVASPGWSFEYARRNPMSTFGYRSLSAGRAYPERLPSGALMIEPAGADQPATRPEARAR